MLALQSLYRYTCHMDYYIIMVIKIAIAAVLAVILGNGSVVAFNHMPSGWFDSDGLPEDTDHRQRLTSSPWKYIFVAYFGVTGIFIALNRSVQFELAVIFVLFIVLLMAVADAKYRIVPDQLSFLLAISAIGFIGFNDNWWEPLAGAGVGIILGLSVWGLGRLIYRSDSIGGADLKFFAAMGLITGRAGILVIFVLTTLFTAAHVAFLLATRRAKLRDKRPMIPYALAAVTVYFMFLWNSLVMLKL